MADRAPERIWLDGFGIVHEYKVMATTEYRRADLVPSPPAISGEEEGVVRALRTSAIGSGDACTFDMALHDKAASLVERQGREIARLSRTESTINDDGTYTPPRHGWTCFHCGETFPPYGIHVHKAREHFGEKPGNPTKCQSEITRLSRELAEARTALGMAGLLADLRAFHSACDVPDLAACGFPSGERIALRLELIREEFAELSDACTNRDIIEAADALADIVYVTVGTALEFGIPLDRVWAEVQRSNMAKVDPETGKVRKRADGKVLKPEGWTAPDIGRALASRNPADGERR